MRRIWTIASNTIKQALRLKVAVVFILLLAILLPVMGLLMTGDGTLKGRLQSFVSYGLSLASLLLCLFTIVVSIYTITSDFEHKQIFTVLTKPIRRFEFLLGKLLGVLILDIGLLILFSSVVYVITVSIPRFSDVSEEQLVQLKNEFYTARASVTAEEEDVSKDVEMAYEKLKQDGRLPQGAEYSLGIRRKIKDQLALRRRLANRSAAVGQRLLWQFNNIKPLDPNDKLFIRFKYDVSKNPLDLQVQGRWVVGDNRKIQYGTATDTAVYSFDRRDLIRTFYEIEVPADAVADDGYLAIAFANIPTNDTVVMFPLEDGLELLYKADSFTANFVRAVLFVLLRLIFLACLGTAAASFLSLPVAVLLCMTILCTGTISGFLIESFDTLSEGMSVIYPYLVKPIVQLLPHFDKFNPGKFLVSARLISWSALARVALFMVCIKASLLILIALVIFSYREIARIKI